MCEILFLLFVPFFYNETITSKYKNISFHFNLSFGVYLVVLKAHARSALHSDHFW